MTNTYHTENETHIVMGEDRRKLLDLRAAIDKRLSEGWNIIQHSPPVIQLGHIRQRAKMIGENYPGFVDER